jgi:ligand-binding sensor domain-containing protein
VWTAIGQGNDVVLKQINPLTLSVEVSESLPVTDEFSGYPLATYLVATVNGPLWVAAGEDLWALNPSTGAVETEFKTDAAIASMSTDPTGRLLYAASPLTADGGATVTEYDARTGQELSQMAEAATTAPGTVAATNSGVWLSARSGMAGGTVELSASGLTEIAPTPAERLGFGTYDQIGGVWASVSEQTLWLTNESGRANLTCANPTTGAVRASGSTPVPVSAPIADGQKLYAIASSNGVDENVVVITPPAGCFG